MNLEHLREYTVLAKHMNFTKAARELFISQPTLSSHMQSLEKELGFDLFDRQRGLGLTRAGALFLERAQTIVRLVENTVVQCRELCCENGRVRVLAGPSAAKLFGGLGSGAAKLVEFVDLPAGLTPFEAVADRMADIAVTNDFRYNERKAARTAQLGLACAVVGRDPCSIVFSLKHPLAAKEHLFASDLADATVSISDGSYFDDFSSALQAQMPEGVSPQFVFKNIGPIENLRTADFGDTCHICGAKLNSELCRGRTDVAIRTLEDVDLWAHLVAVWREGETSAAVLRLLTLLGAEPLARDARAGRPDLVSNP